MRPTRFSSPTRLMFTALQKLFRFSRGEAVGVADIIHGLFYSVDPAETECFIHGFRIANADFARLFLVEPNPKLVDFAVIRCQPFSKVRRRLKERDFHGKLHLAERWKLRGVRLFSESPLPRPESN